ERLVDELAEITAVAAERPDHGLIRDLPGTGPPGHGLGVDAEPVRHLLRGQQLRVIIGNGNSVHEVLTVSRPRQRAAHASGSLHRYTAASGPPGADRKSTSIGSRSDRHTAHRRRAPAATG